MTFAIYCQIIFQKAFTNLQCYQQWVSIYHFQGNHISVGFSFCFYWFNGWKLYFVAIWICLFLHTREAEQFFHAFILWNNVSFACLPTAEFIQPTVMAHLPHVRPVPGLTIYMSSVHTRKLIILSNSSHTFLGVFSFSLVIFPSILKYNSQKNVHI